MVRINLVNPERHRPRARRAVSAALRLTLYVIVIATSLFLVFSIWEEKRAELIIREAHELATTGALPLLTKEKIFEASITHESSVAAELKQMGKLMATPPYLQQLLEVALKNHPLTKNVKLYNFKLWTYLDEWYLCGGGACAFPTGTIMISSKLICAARNEAELVGSLGHEISHVLTEDARRGEAVMNYVRSRGLNKRDRWMMKAMLYNDFEQHVQAELGAIDTMKRAGYNHCTYYTWDTRGETAQIALELVRKSKREYKCGGSLFLLKTEVDFAEFQKSIR